MLASIMLNLNVLPDTTLPPQYMGSDPLSMDMPDQTAPNMDAGALEELAEQIGGDDDGSDGEDD